MKGRTILQLARGLLVLAAVVAASGAVIRVPGDYPTIQQGLDAAATDDTVLVAPGTYYEIIFWPSTQGIDLLSEYGADSTVIDGASVTTVLTFLPHVAADTSTVIRGFTIQNGQGSPGGGLYLAGSSPRIEQNTIRNNSASEGGGICLTVASPVIIGNLVTGCSASLGGGMVIYNYSNPIVTGNQITGNSASDDGGGIYCRWYSSPMISGNTVTDNSAAWFGGAIVCVDSSNPIISGNTINNNSADSMGGGIHCRYHCYPSITDNEMRGNSAHYGGGIYVRNATPAVCGNQITGNSAAYGGGVFCYFDCHPLIRRNVIAENRADSLGDGICCLRGSFPVVDSNSIYNNGCGVYNGDSSEIVMAEYNWWGHATGPWDPSLGPPDYNPGGQGDSVSDYVAYRPWLTDPVGIQEESTGTRHPLDFARDRQALGIRLYQNHPNPFRRTTTIRYSLPPRRGDPETRGHGDLPTSPHVNLSIYDIAGRVVRALVDERQEAGDYSVCWDATDKRGRAVPSGVYFYRLDLGRLSEVRRMVVLR